jgi:hypothetical protein
LTGGELADVTIDLAIDFRRDDESLSAIIANLFAQVKSDDPAARVRSLDVLLPLRSVARNQIAELTTSDEQSVADRASQALSAL